MWEKNNALNMAGAVADVTTTAAFWRMVEQQKGGK